MSHQFHTAFISTMATYSLQQFQTVANKLNVFLQSWPELTVNQMTKYTSIYEATSKCHMYAQK